MLSVKVDWFFCWNCQRLKLIIEIPDVLSNLMTLSFTVHGYLYYHSNQTEDISSTKYFESNQIGKLQVAAISIFSTSDIDLTPVS